MSASKGSRFLSYILRHHPSAVGLVLDKGGWITIEELLKACARHGRKITKERLHHIVTGGDKERFSISQDGLRIRASYGHTVDIELALPEAIPPEILYHGTTKRFLPRIFSEGIKPGKRLYVHLSEGEKAALSVGSRHGPPRVLHVVAGQMHRDGFRFFRPETGAVWLTEWVPGKYIELKSL